MNKKEYLRQFISDFLQGTNFEALLGTIADESQKQDELSYSVNNQLYISTASEEYLDKVLSQYGVTRPPELGMEDLAFRKMGIQITAQKQITEVLHTVLETFFGDETVRAYAQSTLPEPYQLEDSDELLLELENGDVLTIPFFTTDFASINSATSQEIANVISRFTRSQGINSYATDFLNTLTGKRYVRIFGAAKGPYSMVRILGGKVQSVLEFPLMRNTELLNNTTIWQVTRTVGSTIRFRWYSGPQPTLNNVVNGDSVLMYGQQFSNQGFYGTYTVTDIRPSSTVPSYDAGWFEITDVNFQGLKSSLPNIAPSTNTVTGTYSFLIQQNSYADLKFYLPRKHTPYSQQRYALAFESNNNLLKIYIPATTKVVRRDLIGSAHFHSLYDRYNLDGTFGHLSDPKKQVEVMSDMEIRYPQTGCDNLAFGGTLSYDSTEVEIDYTSRSNGYASVKTLTPHGIKGDALWQSSKSYVSGDKVFYENAIWEAKINSGTLYGGARIPNSISTYWQIYGNGRLYSSKIVSVVVDRIESEDIFNPYPGPYMIDPTAPYALTSIEVKAKQKILAGTKIKTLFIQGDIPTEPGLLLFGLNAEKQEGPVKYFSAQTTNAPTSVTISNITQTAFTITVHCTQSHGAIPGSQVNISGITSVLSLNGIYTVDAVIDSLTYTCTSSISLIASAVGQGVTSTILTGSAATLILDPSYTFKNNHEIGTDITLLSDRVAYTPDLDGTDFSLYLTGTTDGRIFCEDLIRQITALGIQLEIVVIYPKGLGLGHGEESVNGAKFNDVVYIWG